MLDDLGKNTLEEYSHDFFLHWEDSLNDLGFLADCDFDLVEKCGQARFGLGRASVRVVESFPTGSSDDSVSDSDLKG